MTELSAGLVPRLGIFRRCQHDCHSAAPDYWYLDDYCCWTPFWHKIFWKGSYEFYKELKRIKADVPGNLKWYCIKFTVRQFNPWYTPWGYRKLKR